MSASPLHLSSSAHAHAHNHDLHKSRDVNCTLCSLEPDNFDNLAFEVSVPPREAAKLYKAAYRQHSYRHREATRAPEGFMILS